MLSFRMSSASYCFDPLRYGIALDLSLNNALWLASSSCSEVANKKCHLKPNFCSLFGLEITNPGPELAS